MSSANWWAKKLNAPVPPPTVTAAAINGPAAHVATQTGQRPASGRASHQRANGICPECGGDNYFAARADNALLSGPSPAARCFDCGYPVRQTTSGMGGISDGGTTAPSKQTGPGNNFNPNSFIGRVG